MKRKTGSRGPSRILIPRCSNFTGYKPCFPGARCLEECADFRPIGKTILLINLDAMGNVLATTALLAPLKRKYPRSRVSWVTLGGAAPLLLQNPFVDRVYAWEPENLLILQQMNFDLVLNIDKSRRSAALAMAVRAKKKMGFGLNGDGVIIPLNKEAFENYRLGLDDHLKFRVNTKTVPQLQCEEFGLRYRRDPYVLPLTAGEEEYCRAYRQANGLRASDLVVGFNTGCSELYPNKKMTIDQHVSLIRRLAEIPGVRQVIVGGPEDTARNSEIERRAPGMVLNTPTNEGVRRGICYVNVCDAVITGDSFGMHIAIALRKHVIAWFGVSCPAEIDLFGRGIKLIPEGLECSPCWKHQCPYTLECIQMIDLDAMVREIARLRGAAGDRSTTADTHA